MGPEPVGGDTGYGVPVARVRELVEFRRHRYDWRAWEARLNEHPPDLLVADLGNLFAGCAEPNYLPTKPSSPATN
jgi:hypothetical protein